jgi:hypothetical protein
MELLSEAHGDRFVVPDAITLEQLEDSKRGVCALLPYGTKYEDWYPPLVVTYASGRRTNRKGVADDCEGSGPGVMYAKGLMEFLHERGLQCFSGLQVPPGVDWETFMLRLTGENGKREKPKVFIIILTSALYQSKPCLKEIDTAIKHEVELLPVRFEDNLPGKAAQWTNLKGQEWEMRKFRVQEKLNALNNIPNPGTVLNRPTSLQDIVVAIEKHLPAPASPATSTPTPPPPPPPKPSGGPSEGPRFPVGSRVYVDQGHGQESLAHVATYNAARGVYVVELGARGSGALEICSDKDLRRDDNPMSLFIDSARESMGNLFGITPFVIEHEGATTENAPAAKPTPQPPASPTKPAPKPPPKHTESWACSACTLINAPHRSTCRACETPAPPPPSIDQPVGDGRVPHFQPTMPQPPTQRFKLNERVECRDRGKSWQVGTVVSVALLKVQPDGVGWTAGYVWDEVRVLSAELRAEEERRAAQAAAELRAEEERRAAREAPVKNFRGPCADCCKPLAPCCCVSADGEAIFGCVPTEPEYLLPACLHMALCPQMGCDSPLEAFWKTIPNQPQEACLTNHERRRCLCGGLCSRRACATAAQHARPDAVRLRAHRTSRFCIVQGSVLPFGDAPCVRFNGRENRGRGRPVSAARKPRGAAVILHPCLQHGIREETEGEIVGDQKRLATCLRRILLHSSMSVMPRRTRGYLRRLSPVRLLLRSSASGCPVCQFPPSRGERLGEECTREVRPVQSPGFPNTKLERAARLTHISFSIYNQRCPLLRSYTTSLRSVGLVLMPTSCSACEPCCGRCPVRRALPPRRPSPAPSTAQCQAGMRRPPTTARASWACGASSAARCASPPPGDRDRAGPLSGPRHPN